MTAIIITMITLFEMSYELYGRWEPRRGDTGEVFSTTICVGSAAAIAMAEQRHGQVRLTSQTYDAFGARLS